MEQPGVHSDAESFVYIVSSAGNGVRLDHYLVQAAASGVSRSQIGNSIKSGAVRVNGCSVKAGFRLKSGDKVSGYIEDVHLEIVVQPQPVDFDVLYEDSFLLVIVKPPGLVVHPGSGNRDNTLVNGLVYRYENIAGVGDSSRPGIVHRLDKDTSGIMLIARTRDVHRKLVQDFKDRAIQKRYLTLVHGAPDSDSGRIVEPIGRHPVKRQKMAVRYGAGRYSASNWKVREVLGAFSLVEVHIETGRTHQIRVHMAYMGCPVAGDQIYGPHRHNDRFPRQMLHAWKLQFRHPFSGKEMMLEAPLSADFSTILNDLRTSAC